MERHQNCTQTKVRKLKCELCSCLCESPLKLKIHEMTHEKRTKTHLCNICSKSLSSELGLSKHMKMHFGKKEHQCNMCEESFAHPNSFKAHLRMHTGEVPFQCLYCDRAYRSKSSLSAHTQNVHATNQYEVKTVNKT